MKKRILSLLLALVFVLSFAGCGADVEETEKATEKQTETEAQTPSETVTEAEISDATVPEITEDTTEEVPDNTVPEVQKKAVDTAALDQIEQQDTFAVRMIQKEAVKGAFDNGSAVVDPKGEDGYVLTIMNNSGAKIDEIKFLVLATNKNGQACGLGFQTNIKPGSFFAEDLNYNYWVEIMSTSTANLEANATGNVGIQCRLSDISYMNVIVLSYIDSNGNEIINEHAAIWLTNTVER